MTAFSISATMIIHWKDWISNLIRMAPCILFLLLMLGICVILIVTIKRARLTDVDLEPAEPPKAKTAAENNSDETDVKSTSQEENRP